MTIDIAGLYPYLGAWLLVPAFIFVVAFVGFMADTEPEDSWGWLAVGGILTGVAALLVVVITGQFGATNKENAVQYALETQLSGYDRWVIDPDAGDIYIGITDDGVAEEYLVRQVDETDTYTVRLIP